MSANPTWSYAAEEYPTSCVIALFDTTKEVPEVAEVAPVQLAIVLAPCAQMVPANDIATASRFSHIKRWVLAVVTAIVSALR